MRTAKWIIFGMLVELLAGCSGKKTAETSADAKNAESTDEKNTLDFVDAHGERYTVEINEAVAKNPYDKALFVKNENKISYEDKKYTSRLGVDVSVFQGDIDWEQVTFGRRRMKESAFAILAACSISSCVASSFPKRMFSATVPVNRWVSCRTIPREWRRASFSISFTSMPS